MIVVLSILESDIELQEQITDMVRMSHSETVFHRNGTIKYSHDWPHSSDEFKFNNTLTSERVSLSVCVCVRRSSEFSSFRS